jgi:hypothetical protein
MTAIYNINHQSASKNLVKSLLKLINLLKEKNLEVQTAHTAGTFNQTREINVISDHSQN